MPKTFYVTEIREAKNKLSDYLVLQTKRGKLKLYLSFIPLNYLILKQLLNLKDEDCSFSVDTDNQTVNGNKVIGNSITLPVTLQTQQWNNRVIKNWVLKR